MISTPTLFIWAGSNTVQNNCNISVNISLAVTYMQRESSHLAGIQTGMCFCRHHLNLRLSSSKIEISSLIQCTLVCFAIHVFLTKTRGESCEFIFLNKCFIAKCFRCNLFAAYFILVISLRIRLLYIVCRLEERKKRLEQSEHSSGNRNRTTGSNVPKSFVGPSFVTRFAIGMHIQKVCILRHPQGAHFGKKVFEIGQDRSI